MAGLFSGSAEAVDRGRCARILASSASGRQSQILNATQAALEILDAAAEIFLKIAVWKPLPYLLRRRIKDLRQPLALSSGEFLAASRTNDAQQAQAARPPLSLVVSPIEEFHR